MAQPEIVSTADAQDTPGFLDRLLLNIPGIALTAFVAWAGLAASEWIGTALLGFERSPVSGIMMAIIFGLVLSNIISLPAWVKPGVTFSLKRLLKLGIILLGIRLSLGAVVQIGLIGLPVIILCVVGAVIVAGWLGKRLGISERLSTLIAVGTSICGATAIVAAGPTLDAKEEEVTYAVANITIFGILAMFFYPYIANTLFPTSDLSAGLFLGTSIHETAQVAGSGLIYSEMYNNEAVLNIATITKLVRNLFMVTIIPVMAYYYQRRRQIAEKKTLNLMNIFPVFILGFVFMAFMRTFGDATLEQSGNAFWVINAGNWHYLVDTIKEAAEILLAVAMAGVGLGTSFRQLRSLGITPFYVGLASAMIVAVLSLSALAVLQVLGVA